MRRNLARLRRLVIALCATLGALFLLVTFTPLTYWWARPLAGPWNDPGGRTLIVLAGADLSGLPDTNTVLRCIYAVRAWHEGGFRKVVVTGRNVSEHMRNLLIAEGVPPEAVVTEGYALSTRENAVNTARLLAGDPGPIVLLTSDYHMFRAVRVFRRAGLAVLPRPIPDALKRYGNRAQHWNAFLDEASETCKIVYYRIRGWI
jgi:uncharacterized SAM-binding protein YcdF (DUF218 family)